MATKDHFGSRPVDPRTRQASVPQAVAAPFRFVSLEEKITPPEGEHSLDVPIPGGFCATISVEWAAETPLLIGSGEDGSAVRPMQLPGDTRYVIPGASLRGLLLSCTQIVALGRLGASDLHFRFGIRDFKHQWYGNVIKTKTVRAGWLTKRVDQTGAEAVYITPLSDLGWAKVEVDDVLRGLSPRGIHDRRQWIRLDLKRKYEFAQNGPVRFTADNSARFTKPAADRGGQQTTSPAADGAMRGWYVFSGAAVDPRKHIEYVFFDEPTSRAPVALKTHVWETFKRLHSKPSKNAPEAEGSWKFFFDVVGGGFREALKAPVGTEAQAHTRRVPVFYVGDIDGQGDDFAFGLTRLFKLPHRRSIAGTLPTPDRPMNAHDPSKRFVSAARDGALRYEPDFVDMLFGFVEEPHDAMGQRRDVSVAPGDVARKGRIAFSFATLKQPKSATPSPQMSVVQMGPRASYGPLYLSGATGKDRDYSGSAPRIAGRKRYIPRHLTPPGGEAFRQSFRALAEPHLNPANERVKSQLVFLEPAGAAKDIRFESEIRLHNVTAAELGAVLFALTHGGDPDKPYRHMLGRAKAFGAGQMRVESARLSLMPSDERGKAFVKAPAREERAFCPATPTDPSRNASHRPFLKAFVDYLDNVHGGDLTTNKSILQFFAACSPETGAREAAAGTLHYMSLKGFAEVRSQDRSHGPGGTLLPLKPMAPALPKVWAD